MVQIAFCIFATACEIQNDIPYPIVDGDITGFEVKGMCDENGNAGGTAKIDKSAQTVSLFVDDTVDPKSLPITCFTVTNDAEIVTVGDACLYPNEFPKKSFSISPGEFSCTDFTNPVHFILRTYQDYDWTVNLTQIIRREVEMDGQVGNAVIDSFNRTVIVNVNSSEDTRRIKVNKFTLGGQHGNTAPDPTGSEGFDFSEQPVVFNVTDALGRESEWTVFVYKTEAKTPLTAEAFARTVSASVSGTKSYNETVTVEYKKDGSSSWITCPKSSIKDKGLSYTADIKGLAPSTKYTCRAKTSEETSPESSFTTTAATQLENPSLDDWSQEGERLYNPWSSGGSSFWDTGNRGATTVGDSNSKPSDESSTGKGKSAILTSKYIVIKFAAGNIFTGKYVKTDGTNGILDFGRPFTAFPSALTFDYKYKGAAINRIGSNDYAHLKGTPDECQVYVALADWDEPLQIRTNPKDLSLFDKNDPHVIAYADMIRSEEQASWKTETLTLKYKYSDRTPKYILVVCSSSRYGDFFTGGEGSTLQVDNFRLVYDELNYE